MAQKNRARIRSAEIRRRAEERVQSRAETAASRVADTGRLVHELEVHQVELELQNEELRKARTELEANYNELYDFAPIGYFTLGRNGDIQKTNLTGAGMLGQPRARLLGRRFATFVSPESLPSFNGFLHRVMRGNNKESCMITLMKGGDTPVAAYIEATRMGSDSSFRAVAADITSAEQAKAELRDSKQHLNMALAASLMGVWEWERDTGDIYWSPECFKIFGVASFCPTLDTLTHLLHPEDAPRVRSTVSQLLVDGKARSQEIRIIRPGGKVARILVRGEGQYDKAGKVFRLVGIAQDITERKPAAQNASPEGGVTDHAAARNPSSRRKRASRSPKH